MRTGADFVATGFTVAVRVARFTGFAATAAGSAAVVGSAASVAGVAASGVGAASIVGGGGVTCGTGSVTGCASCANSGVEESARAAAIAGRALDRA